MTWARGYWTVCQECGRNDQRHASGGYCKVCWDRLRYSQEPVKHTPLLCASCQHATPNTTCSACLALRRQQGEGVRAMRDSDHPACRQRIDDALEVVSLVCGAPLDQLMRQTYLGDTEQRDRRAVIVLFMRDEVGVPQRHVGAVLGISEEQVGVSYKRGLLAVRDEVQYQSLLERLSDAFALRERQRQVRRLGAVRLQAFQRRQQRHLYLRSRETGKRQQAWAA